MKALLLGAGNSRQKQIVHNLTPLKEFDELVTLDIDPDCGADIEWDLDYFPYPIEDDDFDEIHAYEILEHCGFQGDERYFFRQFNEFHRILRDGGLFCGSVPHYQSIWAFGDPGHTRVLPPCVFNFLQKSYYDEVGKTPLADYRHLIKGYWEGIGIEEKNDRVFFLLRKA